MVMFYAKVYYLCSVTKKETMSPKFLVENGLIFKVFSREEERMHVHIERDGNKAKVWLEPTVELAENKGFRQHEINKIIKKVEENADNFRTKWNKYFNR